jgi:hypothetical protein
MLSFTNSALIVLNAVVVTIGVPALVAAFIYIGRQFQKLDTLNATMDGVKHNINLCTFALIKMNKIDTDKVVAFSPASLTREGCEYIARIGIKGLIDDDEHSRALFSSIEGDKPRTRYDVELSAVTAIFAALIESTYVMQAVKVYLYNHPSEDMRSIAYLAGLYLRDRYLSTHPEIAE